MLSLYHDLYLIGNRHNAEFYRRNVLDKQYLKKYHKDHKYWQVPTFRYLKDIRGHRPKSYTANERLAIITCYLFGLQPKIWYTRQEVQQYRSLHKYQKRANLYPWPCNCTHHAFIGL